MAKKLEKSNIITLIFALAIITAVGIFSVAATFAATDNWLRVEHTYAATSSTDVITASVNNGTTVNIELTPSSGEFHFTKYDVIVYSEGDNSLAPESQELSSETFDDCMVIKNIDIVNTSIKFTNIVTFVYAYPSAESNGEKTISYGNVYAGDFFTFQSLNNANNVNPSDPTAINGAFKNVFILGGSKLDKPIIFDKPLTFTPPSMIHLLRSNVELRANLTLKHAYGGVYGIDTAGGAITEKGGTFKIITPNAYFGVAEGVVKNSDGTDKTALDITCAHDAITVYTASALVTNLLDSATAYVENLLPKRLTRNVVLPLSYFASGIDYTYSVSNDSLTTNGVIYRADTTSEVNLTVTVTYRGIYSKVLSGTSEALTKKSVDLTLNVVGTGDKAAVDELSAMVDEALKGSMTIESELADGGKMYTPRGAVDITELLKSYRELGFAPSVPVVLSVSEPSGSAFTIDGITAFSYTLPSADEAIKNIRLEFASMLINGASLALSATCGEISTEQAYTLAGMDIDEVTYLLDTLVFTPEFSSADTIYRFVSLFNESLYRGTEKVASSLGVKSAQLIVITLSDTELSDLNTATNQQAFIAAKWEVWSNQTSSSFVITELTDDSGTLQGGTISVSKLDADVNYVIVQNFEVDLDISNPSDTNVNYYLFRVALVPDVGVGGDETTQYIAGNTFADFYKTLDNGRLLESGGYEFAISSTGVGIYALIEGENVGTYCWFAYKVDGNYVPVSPSDPASFTADKYYICVDISKFPEYNATAKAKIYFYYATAIEDFKAYAQSGFIDNTDHPEYAESCFTTQSYSFTLPGIYQSGENRAFASYQLYDLILNAKDGEQFIYDAYRKNPNADGKYTFDNQNYLYADGASALCSMLDASSIGTGIPIDLKGIELLTGTSGFIFNGVAISSMSSAFATPNTHIKSLSLVNCGLTEAIIGSGLLKCQGLQTIDISENSIGSIVGLFYRTVTSLSARNCGLTTIVGIGSLPNLITLDLSANKIAYFGGLIGLAKLRTVNVSNNNIIVGNIAVGSGAYGTSGEVNIPVYVYLLNVRETTIIGNDNTTIGIGSGISKEQQIASLILTGVEYDRVIKGDAASLTFSKDVVWGEQTYPVSSVGLVSTDFAEISGSTLDVGSSFYFIVKVTYDGTTCYALYEAIYGGAL